MINGNNILAHVRNTISYLRTKVNEDFDLILLNSACGGMSRPDKDHSKELVVACLEAAQPVFWDVSIFASAVRDCDRVFLNTPVRAFSPQRQIWIPANEGYRKNGEWGPVLPCMKIYRDKHNLQKMIEAAIMAVILAYVQKDNRNYILSYAFFRLLDDSDLLILMCEFREVGYVNCDPLSLFNVINAGLSFMSQPFVEKSQLDQISVFTGSHHQSKKNDAKKIQIIYLRRREQHPILSDGTHNPVDWSCQWLVHGHWRNQFHPSDNSHAPVFIQSYVKGPEDKPFKASQQSIYATVR